MKTMLGLSSWSASIILACVVVGTLARPDPKAAWVRNSHGRKGLMSRRSQNANVYGRDVNTTTSTASCADNEAKSVTSPYMNVWNGLSDIEAASVVSWLFAQSELNLTTIDNATAWDNTILLVELQTPNKSDVLPYIDGTGPAPTRYAHVILDVRASDDPYFQDILVGPLPIQNSSTATPVTQISDGQIQASAISSASSLPSTTWEPLEYPYTRKTSGKVRNLGADEDLDGALYESWLYPISDSIKDITLDLWNGTFLGLENDTLDVFGIDPLWQDDGRIIRWDMFWNLPTDDFDAETLLPLGLYFQSDVTGRDPSTWQLLGWLYNDIYYTSTDEFRAAYWAPGFVKLGANVEGDWAITDQQGDVLPDDTAAPPVSVAPGGSRYSVDAERKYIEWMDFSFYVGFSRDTGMALYDIKYKGDRILYELGLQEALAHYAGNDPVQSGTSYLDTYYGFGPYAFELVQGYDCPAYATYLNTSFYVSETTHTHINSLCLFEFTADFPIQRHSTSEYVSVTKNTAFTIRSVSTVGNYDYMFSYTFSIDGSISIEVRASGYIQSAFYAHNGDYGYQIHDSLSGSMHDHVLNFKADFDILGLNNTIELVTNKAITTSYPWSGNKTRNTMHLTRSTIESEDSSRMNWDPNGATQFKVINNATRNAYGEARGYRILPNSPTMHLTVENSSNLVNAAGWANHDIQVTRQHDTEPKSAHAYNSQDVHNPPINFDAFFDGESLLQEDLVVWLNLGMHHVPHTGDLPNTVFTTAHSGVTFMPLNYLDLDASRQTVNMVRINYGGGEVSEVELFGQGSAVCEVSVGGSEMDVLNDYVGDVVVRKFPFSPNDPYFETDSVV